MYIGFLDPPQVQPRSWRTFHEENQKLFASVCARSCLKQNETLADQIDLNPPPIGWYKVYNDGVIFSKQICSGIGVIVQDDQGRVVAAMSKNLQVPLCALEIEAKAIEMAVNLSWDINIQDIIVKSDSMAVCSALQQEVMYHLPLIISQLFYSCNTFVELR